jgi:colanic acid biosynthesis glycosyl transferase WcaI
MAEYLSNKGVASDRIAIVRNWVDLDHVKPMEGVNPYRRELGIADKDFVVLYSGNIGAKQGLDQLLSGIVRLKDRTDIQFIIAGEGPAKAELVALFGHLDNLRFLPFQPEERLSEFLGLADMHVLPQQSAAADFMLPSKLGGMLASGRRIVATAAVGTELAAFLEGAAVLVTPDDPAALAEAIGRGAEDTHFGDDNPSRRRQLASQLSKADALKNLGAILV